MIPKLKNKPVGSLIFIHGGGWGLGDWPGHRRMLHDIVVQSNVIAFHIDYTVGPNVQYPTVLNEINIACDWICKNCNKFGIHSKNIVLCGNSVGGNMAAVTAIEERNKKKKRFNIKLQILLWPVATDEFNSESMKKYKSNYWLEIQNIKGAFKSYAPKTKTYKIAPLKASMNMLSKLPPTLVIVCGHDILKDDAIDFSRKLDKAGVNVSLLEFPNTIHDFGLLDPLSNAPDTKLLFRVIGTEINHFL